MELNIRYVDIKDMEFSAATAFHGGVLSLNREELTARLADPCFSAVELELARPGESCRISRARDVIQPMLKLDDPDATFPGLLGKTVPAGGGSTLKLRGAAVVETYELPLPRNHFIDMSGPNAEYTPFSKTVNLVVSAHPAQGVEQMAYGAALKRISLLAAKYLAQAAAEAPPSGEEQLCFDYNSELQLLDEAGNILPRVAYVHQYLAASEQIEQVFYGKGYYTSLPMLFHPLEFLDGAVMNKNYLQSMNADVSYFLQNHPMITELLSRHGKDLNFAGVVYCHTPWSFEDKDRNAMMAVQLLKQVLKADAVVITKEGGGHPQIDLDCLCRWCEKAGIQTQISFFELNTTSGSCEEVLLFYNPAVDAIASFGCLKEIELPVMGRIIGSRTMAGAQKPLDQPGNRMNNWDIRGAMSQLGECRYKSIKY